MTVQPDVDRHAPLPRANRLIRSQSPWTRGVVALLTGAALVAAGSVGAALFTVRQAYLVSFDREDLPDAGPFARFEFPAIGHVYDASGQPLDAHGISRARCNQLEHCRCATTSSTGRAAPVRVNTSK